MEPAKNVVHLHDEDRFLECLTKLLDDIYPMPLVVEDITPSMVMDVEPLSKETLTLTMPGSPMLEQTQTSSAFTVAGSMHQVPELMQTPSKSVVEELASARDMVKSWNLGEDVEAASSKLPDWSRGRVEGLSPGVGLAKPPALLTPNLIARARPRGNWDGDGAFTKSSNLDQEIQAATKAFEWSRGHVHDRISTMKTSAPLSQTTLDAAIQWPGTIAKARKNHGNGEDDAIRLPGVASLAPSTTGKSSGRSPSLGGKHGRLHGSHPEDEEDIERRRSKKEKREWGASPSSPADVHQKTLDSFVHSQQAPLSPALFTKSAVETKKGKVSSSVGEWLHAGESRTLLAQRIRIPSSMNHIRNQFQAYAGVLRGDEKEETLPRFVGMLAAPFALVSSSEGLVAFHYVR